MNRREIDNLRRLMAYERARTAPPVAFPNLPPIPAGRYTDPKFFELEQEHIWKKTWLLAGHLDELPEPGSFRLWENMGQPVLLIRTREGGVNAFYNTCRHRGAPIVTEPAGKRSLLTCKYHGWTYGQDGALLSIRDPEDFRNLDKSCLSLIKVRCELFGKFIFVNFDEDAVPLVDWLGPIADDWKEFQFDKCRLAARHIFDLDCNWKVAMEANLEVYHIRNIHPTSVGLMIDDRQNVNTLYDHGHARMVCPARDEAPPALALTTDRPARAEIETVGEIGRTCTLSYNLFPNWVSPLSEYSLPPLLFWPNGIGKCRFETWTVAPDWGDGPGPDLWTVNDGERLCDVLLEDTEFGKWIQKSMNSGGFKSVPLSYQEARIYHWNQAADRMIGVDNIPEALRVPQVIGPDWIYPNDPRLDEIDDATRAAAA
jgi:phenylpropionate dioxygenase-like ring-hydroxylating dioxygenase large terminal subunit